MRTFLIAFLALTLSGCALTDKLLTNRITTTLAQDECRVDSRWAVFGISTPISEEDCITIIEGAKALQAKPASR